MTIYLFTKEELQTGSVHICKSAVMHLVPRAMQEMEELFASPEQLEDEPGKQQ